MDTYPRPHTTATRALAYIEANPGCTKRSLGRNLGINEGGLQRVLDQLTKHQLVTVETDEQGYRRISLVPRGAL
jgi:DNA-binding MarR family transcriptional regulator